MGERDRGGGKDSARSKGSQSEKDDKRSESDQRDGNGRARRKSEDNIIASNRARHSEYEATAGRDGFEGKLGEKGDKGVRGGMGVTGGQGPKGAMRQSNSVSKLNNIWAVSAIPEDLGENEGEGDEDSVEVGRAFFQAGTNSSSNTINIGLNIETSTSDPSLLSAGGEEGLEGMLGIGGGGGIGGERGELTKKISGTTSSSSDKGSSEAEGGVGKGVGGEGVGGTGGIGIGEGEDDIDNDDDETDDVFPVDENTLFPPFDPPPTLHSPPAKGPPRGTGSTNKLPPRCRIGGGGDSDGSEGWAVGTEWTPAAAPTTHPIPARTTV